MVEVENLIEDIWIAREMRQTWDHLKVVNRMKKLVLKRGSLF